MAARKVDPHFSCVDQLWNDFKNYKQLSINEENRKTLLTMLNLFNPKFMQWNEEFEMEFLQRIDYKRKTTHIPQLDNNSALTVSKLFEYYMYQVIKQIKENTTFHNLNGIEFIYLLSLLLRRSENLSKFGNSINVIVLSIMNLLFSVQSKNPFGVDIKGVDEEPFEVEHIFIQLLVANCFQILIFTTSFNGSWKSISDDRTPKEEKIINECKKELLKNGILKVIKGFFDQLQSIQNSNGLSGSQEDFKMLVLNLLGSLLKDFPATKSAAIQFGLIDTMVDFMKWPDKLIANNFDVNAAQVPKLRDEYRLQILCLQVVKEAIDRNTANSQRFSCLGGWEKVIDFIMWSTEIFSINPVLIRAKLSDNNEPILSRWSSVSKRMGVEIQENSETNIKVQRNKTIELQMIFEILFQITIGSIPERRDRSDPVLLKSNFNRYVVQILIDLFNIDIRHTENNARVREKLKEEYPELQMFVLEFFSDLVSQYPNSINYLTQYRFWDALFTSSFYFCGVDEKLVLLPSVVAKDLERHNLFSKMKFQVILFLEYAICIPGFDNVEICQKLVNILSYYSQNLDVIITLSQTFSTILANSLPTQASLIQLNILNIIGNIIKEQQALYSMNVESKVKMARISMLNLLVKMIGNDTKYIQKVISNPVTTESIFLILYEPILCTQALNIIIILMTSPINKNTETFDDLLKVYDRYFSILLTSQNISFELTISLLHGIVRIAKDYRPSKNIFRKKGAFLNITNILNAESNTERIPILCIEVLRTLIALMSHNPKNKFEMKTIIGYDQLKDLIIHSLSQDVNNILAKNIQSIIFDMLVDGSFDIDHRYTIRNPDVISLMFLLLMSLPTTLIYDFLDTFSAIVIKSPRNQSLCCEKELIFTLLGLIQTGGEDTNILNKLINLLEILGSHSITVKELKKQFFLMKSELGDFRPLFQSRLLKTLQFMALSRGKGPLSYFDFDGSSSALAIQAIERWPNNNGYTFCFWVRNDSNYHFNSRKVHPRIVSLLDKEGFGMELFFSCDHSLSITLNLSISTPEKTITKEFRNFVFKDKRWYFITVTHSNSRNILLRNEGEAKLFVNGDYKDKLSIRYTQFTHLSHNKIGASVDLTKHNKLLHQFSGQIGYILLFDGYMSAPQIFNLFQICSENAINKSSSFGELEYKIQLYYNCTARIDNKFLDLTPERNREKRILAKKIGNLHTAITKDVKDIIHCIGGIQVLIPFFAQLDQPLAPKSPDDPIDYTVDKQLLLQTIGLIGDMLAKSETNQQEMLRCQGFSVIGYLLQKASPEHLTAESIIAIEDLANKILTFQALYDDLWINVNFNWKIWIYASPSVQWELTRLFYSLSVQNTEWVRKLFGVQKLLDLNYYFFWYENKCIGAQGVDQILHPVTKKVLGQRPKENELYTLRKQIFDIIFVLLKEGVTEAEVATFCRMIMETKDNLQVVEILQFIMINLDIIPNFADVFLNYCGINFFVLILKREEEKVRVNALKVIGLLSHALNRRREREKDQKEKEKAFDFNSIFKILCDFSFSKNIYSALFEVLTGTSLEAMKKSSADHDSVFIKTPQIIPVLFNLLPQAEIELKEEILHDIYLLLSNNSINREKIIHIYGWQNWFLTYLETLPQTDEANSNNVSYEYTLNIMKVLILQTLCIEKLIYKTLHQFEAFLYQFSAKNSLNHEEITRSLLTKIITTLVSANKLIQSFDIKSPIFLNNIILLIGIVDEFLYYTPSVQEIIQLQAGKKQSNSNLFNPNVSTTMFTSHVQNNKWLDFELAKLCYLLIESFGILRPAQYAVVDPIVKDEIKSNILRPGGVSRIILKFLLNIIEEGDSTVAIEYVPSLNIVLERDITNYKSGNSERLIYCLSSLIVIMKKIISTIDEDDYFEKAKAILPIIRDLIKLCSGELPSSSELHYFAETSSVKEFIERFHHPPLNAICIWAEKKKLYFVNEEKNFLTQIEKHKLKLNAAISQFLQKEKKSELQSEKKLEDDFQMFYIKILDKEIERKAALVTKTEEEKKNVQRTWRNIFRSLTNSRAPWNTSESVNYWKLAKTETYSRMRIKLKRNYYFDSHAGTVRDGSIQKIEEERNEVESLKLFSGIKLSAMDEENDDPFDGSFDNNEDNNSNALNASVTSVDQDKILLTAYCELITPLKITVGKLEVHNTYVYFKEESLSEQSQKEIKFPHESLLKVFLRRYLHRRSAIEVFLTDRTSHFFNFKKKERNKVYNKIISTNPPNLTFYETGSLEQILKKSELTKKWQMRLISNFDYLMELNTIAGRTFNDITQYPVFPWILTDYESETIDLNNPKIYRDLSKPIGALNPKRLEGFIVRYENFNEPEIPKFHYGSHYSSSGIVLFYLIRMEPFTTLFLKLQGGKFDHADRAFHSIPDTWNGVYTNPSDVKELIPEFFYMPEFLVNSNKFYFGTTQKGVTLNHVVLPRWASTPEEFVRIHRAALESDYVSAHLHEWIDLVFGFKQKGKTAVEAFNVFYYLTYEGSVDIDAIEDDAQRRATESQIDNFGQTPAQILRKPHPSRLPLIESHQSLLNKLFNRLTPKISSFVISRDPIVFVCYPNYYFHPNLGLNLTDNDTITIVDESRYPYVNRFLPSVPTQTHSFTFEVDVLAGQRRKIGAIFATNLNDITSQFFACTPDGKVVFSAGHWDYTVKVTWVTDNSKSVQSLLGHKDLVTCLSISIDGKYLVSGSRDTTCLVWELSYFKGSYVKIEETPLHILYGHNDEVTCVVVESGLDVCVSGSNDGTCIIHNLRRGTYHRSIYHPNDHPISLLAVSSLGHLAIYSKRDLVIFIFNINGEFLGSIETNERINNIIFNQSSQFIITGSGDGITIRTVFGLKTVLKIPTNSKITSMTMSNEESHLVVGLNDGNILVISIEEKLKSQNCNIHLV